MGDISRYVEPTLRARQLFFLAMLLFAGLAFLTSRLDQLLPPLNKDVLLALDEVLERSLAAAVLSTVFFSAFSLVAIYFTCLAVRSGQWPPIGMNVPFRTKVKEIKNPRNAWICFAVWLIIFAVQIVMPWATYAKQQTFFEQVKESMRAR